MSEPTEAHVLELADALVNAVNHQLIDAIGTGDPGPELVQVVLTELAGHTAWLPHDVVDLLRRVSDHIYSGLPKYTPPAATRPRPPRPTARRQGGAVHNQITGPVHGVTVQAGDIGPGGVHVQ